MDNFSADTASLNMDDNAADRKLLIAVDFGTTFSGVAWAQTRRVCYQRGLFMQFTYVRGSRMCKQSSFNGQTVQQEESKV